MSYHRHSKLRFECTACGACCHGQPGDYVAVNHTEAGAIRAALGLSERWFQRHYLVSLSGGQRGLRLRDDGRCILLRADGRCRAYETRPSQCRTYPFWPEIVASRATWRGEAKRCEGIERGSVVPVRWIERQLRLGSEG